VAVAPGVRAASARADGLALVVLGLALAALLALAIWGASPYARYLDHGYQPASSAGQAGALALFLAGWALMIAATMLPTATALLRAVARLGADRTASRRLQALVAAGFLGAWVAVGYAFRAADGLVHLGVEASSWLGERPQLVGASALLVAGAFQFSPLKHRCLTACRSPTSFLYRHWHGERPGRDALRIGVAYGVSCVGCCWALMLVMFGLGAGSIGWMLGVGAIVAVEKNAKVGPRLTVPLGVALLGAAVWVAL
jgi:predicted metal-binding membrane protein